jgi:hypothetical protein
VITLTAKDRRQSWCSWHDNMRVNQEQAARLAADANATKNKLLREAVEAHLGRLPSDKAIHELVTERREPGSAVVWVCWGGKAIAVRTDCRAVVRDKRYNLIWFWKTLAKSDN